MFSLLAVFLTKSEIRLDCWRVRDWRELRVDSEFILRLRIGISALIGTDLAPFGGAWQYASSSAAAFWFDYWR